MYPASVSHQLNRVLLLGDLPSPSASSRQFKVLASSRQRSHDTRRRLHITDAAPMSTHNPPVDYRPPQFVRQQVSSTTMFRTIFSFSQRYYRPLPWLQVATQEHLSSYNFPFTLQQLVVLKAYAVSQSLEEAAATLGMSKSNVSLTLKNMERTLGLELLLSQVANAKDDQMTNHVYICVEGSHYQVTRNHLSLLLSLLHCSMTAPTSMLGHEGSQGGAISSGTSAPALHRAAAGAGSRCHEGDA